MRRMHTLFAHNHSVSYRNAHPDIYLADRNALFLAQPGDAVVMRRREPEPHFIEYFESIGIPLHLVSSFVSTKPVTTYSVFEDTELIERIQQHLNATSDAAWQLDTLMYTCAEQTFAQTLGLTDARHPDLYIRFGSKINLRNDARALGIPLPAGSATTNPAHIGLKLARLFVTGAREAVIKEHMGNTGLSARRIPRAEFINQILHGNHADITPAADIDNAYPDSYVIERWYDKATCSPSAQCTIDSTGAVHIVSMHVQTFTQNGLSYNGCKSIHWLAPATQKHFADMVRAHASYAASCGYVGRIGYDAIVLNNDTVLLVDVNPRLTAPVYPFHIMQRLGFADSLPPYIVLEVQKPHWKGLEYADILHQYKSMIFRKGGSVGIIPYDTKLLNTDGRATFLCIGETRGEAFRVSESIVRNV